MEDGAAGREKTQKQLTQHAMASNAERFPCLQAYDYDQDQERWRYVAHFKGHNTNMGPLSNLRNFVVSLKGVVFSSAEQAYQCSLYVEESSWERYVGLGPDEVMGCFTRIEEMKMIRRHYARGSTGIIEKLWSSPARASVRKALHQRYGIEFRPSPLELDAEELVALWDSILQSKFTENESVRMLLKEMHRTRTYLVEGPPRNGCREDTFWEGVVKKQTGKLEGFNFMGKMLMRTAEKLFG